jgi:DNA-binding XRE family transcriptional regulator
MAEPLQSAQNVIDAWLYLLSNGPTTISGLGEALGITSSQARSAIATLKSRGMCHNGDGIIKPDVPFGAALQSYEARLQAELDNIQSVMSSIRRTQQLTTSSPAGLTPGSDRPAGTAPPRQARWSPSRIRELRDSLGLSQRAAAEEWGIPAGTLKLIETGRREPTDDLVTKLNVVTGGYKAVTK